ncbi:hypothetical protein QAD02_015691 [Eretmocerus hayati]|uniref:Uncharacterized protein n=1 Tax=Eretmocerus hayati TaxID=131215 RepID=A0ACC2P9D9_9HYME|nr:hypothetical protein QAD02_015691 [Eretmocerus hayati]
MDPLQALPVEDWPVLRDSLRRYWPIYACYYHWAVNAINWKAKDPRSAWSIYCPGGKYDPGSGTFIATASNGQYTVVVFTFEESKYQLQEVITHSNIIDWNQEIVFSMVHEHFKDVLKDAIKRKAIMMNIGLVPVEKSPAIIYFKPKDECLKFDFEVPDECYLGPVDVSHIPLVTSLWPHRNRKNIKLSEKYLETFVKLNRSAGLFLKEDNSLVSWILYSDYGSLGQLQTVEKYKRKGYGKLVTKALVKELAEKDGLNSTLFIVKDNIVSHRLFSSLGYRPLNEVNKIVVQQSNIHLDKDDIEIKGP